MTTVMAGAASSDADELVNAISHGDKRQILTLLVARHGPRIYRYALAMTRDHGLAEEIRQQVFVEAFRDLDAVTDPAALATWIFGIARHRSLDAVTARRQWAERYKNEAIELATPDHEPIGDLDRRRMTRLLGRCLAELSPAAREAVVLRYQQELSYDEVAAVTGELAATMRRRVSRALPILRRVLERKLASRESS